MPGPRAILIVDDDPDVAAFLVRLLTASGFEARSAASQAAAAALIRQRPPDLLLVDVMLGCDNGWGVAKTLAQGTPFILMTGARVDSESRVDAELLGARAILQKPFDSAALVDLVKRVLAG